MKYCMKCGTQLEDEVKICPQCGYLFDLCKRPNKKFKITIANLLAIFALCVCALFTVDECVSRLNFEVTPVPEMGVTVHINPFTNQPTGSTTSSEKWEEWEEDEEYRKKNNAKLIAISLEYIMLNLIALICERKAAKETTDQWKKRTCVYISLSAMASIIAYFADPIFLHYSWGFNYHVFIPFLLYLLSGFVLLQVHND